MKFIFSWKKNHSFAALTREIIFPLNDKLHIFAPPCNILYISWKALILHIYIFGIQNRKIYYIGTLFRNKKVFFINFINFVKNDGNTTKVFDTLRNIADLTYRE